RRLGKPLAAFENRSLPIPGQIGCGFTRACRGISVSGERSHRLASAQKAARPGFSNHDIARREVKQKLRASERGSRGERQRHLEVCANLNMKGKIEGAGGAEQEVYAERSLHSSRCDPPVPNSGPRPEMAPLVKFAIVWQIDLRNDAQHCAGV